MGPLSIHPCVCAPCEPGLASAILLVIRFNCIDELESVVGMERRERKQLSFPSSHECCYHLPRSIKEGRHFVMMADCVGGERPSLKQPSLPLQGNNAHDSLPNGLKGSSFLFRANIAGQSGIFRILPSQPLATNYR